MIDHMSTYATDYLKTQNFYDATLPVLGYARLVEFTVEEDDPDFEGNRRVCAYGPPDNPTFWIIETQIEVTPRHFAFTAKSRADVTAFHDAGLGIGAQDNGEPGERPIYHAHYFGSFLIDPDGNNAEAVCHSALTD